MRTLSSNELVNSRSQTCAENGGSSAGELGAVVVQAKANRLRSRVRPRETVDSLTLSLNLNLYEAGGCFQYSVVLPRFELLDQVLKPFLLGRSQVQKFHPEQLSSDPPNDSLVDMHAPAIAW